MNPVNALESALNITNTIISECAHIINDVYRSDGNWYAIVNGERKLLGDELLFDTSVDAWMYAEEVWA